MMITTAARSRWLGEVAIQQWWDAGLRKPCGARPKLFTLDNRLIISRAGALAEEVRRRVVAALRGALPKAGAASLQPEERLSRLSRYLPQPIDTLRGNQYLCCIGHQKGLPEVEIETRIVKPDHTYLVSPTL